MSGQIASKGQVHDAEQHELGQRADAEADRSIGDPQPVVGDETARPDLVDVTYMTTRYDAHAAASAAASTPNGASATSAPAPSAAMTSEETTWATAHAQERDSAILGSIGGAAAAGSGAGRPECAA